MATNKRLTDLTNYTSVLPYASEIFGIYQPLIGWKSKRISARIEKGFANDISSAYDSLYREFKAQYQLKLGNKGPLNKIPVIAPSALNIEQRAANGSFVIDSIASKLPPLKNYDKKIWNQVIRSNILTKTLTKEVMPRISELFQTAAIQGGQDNNLVNLAAERMNREAVIAGYLLFLKEQKLYDKLVQLFYNPDDKLSKVLALLNYQDPFEVFDPRQEIDQAILSPIGIVHLFRQYFFEFDTFLGPPVSHVWLSPGASVELVEISTRKSITERTFESVLETIVKTEKSTTEEDEISDAVKKDNRSDINFSANGSVNQGWIGGSANASASINTNTTQNIAREETHRHMRQQTEKLSTEIRKNYKSTFKTVTEVTDTSSKRYFLENKTENLINYELRRKMRQVGVQVQDIGTYLCWQTYVDNPGQQLGIAKLVHIAKDPDIGSIPPPEAVPMPPKVETPLAISIPFVPKSGNPELSDNDAYEDGKEFHLDFNDNEPESIQADFFDFVAVCDQSGYKYDGIIFDIGGNDLIIRATKVTEESPGRIRFNIHLDHINFQGMAPVQIMAKVAWVPDDSVIKEIDAKNKMNIAQFNEQTKREFHKAFVDAARERIKLASNIEPRKFEDLREEERIVVYRMLIQDMLTKDIPMPDDRTRHVVAELLNTIFDIDKMLYFVAPEWWRPRIHQNRQQIGSPPSNLGDDASESNRKLITTLAEIRKLYEAENTTWTTALSTFLGRELDDKIILAFAQLSFADLITTGGHFFLEFIQEYRSKAAEESTIAPTDTVSWGGTEANRTDNYYITEDSAPAKFGSSLGWLLQLDGDNLRNAFLNAPWVKAVIPIRPGRERAAINWLRHVNVEGADGLDAQYDAPDEELKEIRKYVGHQQITINDAINYLCDIVAKKHKKSLRVGRYPEEEIDDANRVSATPIDKVYEHGFYSLQGGFRVMPANDFEIFDQWIEVLPTDQIVPVEVTYDSKTGRQL